MNPAPMHPASGGASPSLRVGRHDGVVASVNRDPGHAFSKAPAPAILLVEGLGVTGDAHAGLTVQHLSHVARDPSRPNRRQVHLIHAEFHDELAAAGFQVSPGDLGENVTTRGVDLLGLPAGTRLRLGPEAVVEVTGLRNPCRQLDGFADGLLAASLGKDARGEVVRKTGVMAVVVAGGEVRPGHPVVVDLPAPPHHALAPV